MNPKTDSIKLSDCATTLQEARGVIDRQEALIEQLRKDKARLYHLIHKTSCPQFMRIACYRTLADSLAAIDAAMEGEK